MSNNNAQSEALSTKLVPYQRKVKGEYSGNWYVSFYINGKQKHASTGTTNRDEAVRKGPRLYEEALAKHTATQGEESITVKNALEQFLKMKSAPQRSNGKPLAFGTIKSYLSLCERIQGRYTDNTGTLQQLPYAQYLADPEDLLETITEDRLKKFVWAMEDHYTPDAYRIQISRLRNILKFWQSENERTNKRKYKALDLESKLPNKDTDNGQHFIKSPPKTATLTFDQQDELLEIASKSRTKYVNLLMNMLFAMPARINELCSLKYKNIDLTNNTITLKRSKNSRDGKIVMTKRLKQAVLDHAEKNNVNLQTVNPDAYIYPSTGQLGHRNPNSIDFFHNALAQMKDNPNDRPEVIKNPSLRITPHTCRHIQATNAAKVLPKHVVQAGFGHIAESTTDIYIHSDIDDTIEASRLMAANMDRIDDERTAAKSSGQSNA